MFARQLRKAMERNGLSQNELARRLVGTRGPVNPSLVNRWLKGKGLPEGRYILQLPGILGVSADWLLFAKGDVPGEFEQGVEAATVRVLEAVREVRHRAALPWPAESYPPLAPRSRIQNGKDLES